MGGRTRNLETTLQAIMKERGASIRPRNSFPSGRPFDETLAARREQLSEQLINATVANNPARVKELYFRGANASATDERGRRALKYAVFMGHKDIEEFLRARGAKE